jgi:spermidine synthase
MTPATTPPTATAATMSSSRRLLWAGCSLLFSSGCISLVYQAVWMREFRIIFGASTLSTSAVLATFLGGLGLGGWLLGARIEKSARPLLTYGTLELVAAATAALSPYLLQLVHRGYLGLGGAQGLGVFALPVRLVLGSLVLLGPTVAMGGTLPAMARALTTNDDTGRRSLALAYGFNTLGAVTGTLATTFFLFEALGQRATLWCAAGLNAIVGIVARALARGTPDLDPAARSTDGAPRTRGTVAPWVLGASFVCGFAFLTFELVWYRLLSSLLGGSTYSFNVLLATALLGIALGGVWYARDGVRPTWTAFGVTLFLEAFLLLAPLALGDELPFFAHALRSWGQTSFGTIVFGWLILLTVVVFPAAVVAGYQFPLLIALSGQGRAGVAVDAGGVYAANTLGSIAGSLLAGLWMMPALGAWHAGVLAAALLGALSVVLLARERQPVVVVVVIVSLCTVSLRDGPGPVWRGTSVGAGRAPLSVRSDQERKALEAEFRAAEILSVDGVESGIVVHDSEGLSLLVNGKSDGNTIGDAQTTVGAVLLPALLHGQPERSFVVGLGSGQSAGWLASVPTMKHVVVVELEERVVDFAAASAATNHDVLRAQNVDVIVGDGREALHTATETYDVIMSEPSNPYRAGVAGFYSVDFYESALRALSPTGLFAQWLQGYDVDAATVQTVIATLRFVFPHVSVWRTSSSDLLLIAGPSPLVFDEERVRTQLSSEPFHTAFERLFWFTTPSDIATLLIGSDLLTDRLTRGWLGGVNSDDLPLLEFAFARSAGRRSGSVITELVQLSARIGADRLPVPQGTLDWQQVRARRGRHAWPLGVAGPGLPVDAPSLVAAGALQDARDVLLSPSAMASHPADALMELRALVTDKTTASNAGLIDPRMSVLESHGWHTEISLLGLQRALTLDVDVTPHFRAFVEALARDPWLAPGLTNEADAALRAGALKTADALTLLRAPFAGARFTETRRRVLLALHGRDVTSECVSFFGSLGDKIPWRRDALVARLRCFERHAPQRAGEAEADLREFDRQRPSVFVINELTTAP